MFRTRNVLLCVSLLALLPGPAEVLATTDESVASTIDHLLKYVEDSHCVFTRNGTEYDSKDAAKHLRAKYRYFMHKLKTPEDFIEAAGTKSIVSGQPYWVRCDGHLMASAEWLTKELSEYRKALAKERY